jgi:hypothetical protein
LPDLQQVPGLLPSNQQFYGSGIGAGTVFGTSPSPFTYPAAYLGNPMNAILQLRAAGVWV